MSTLLRLCLILGVLLLLIGGALWQTHEEGQSSLLRLQQEQRDERGRTFERAVLLHGAGLTTLTGSYSWWSDMVRFMETRDPTWVVENVDPLAGAPNAGDALWVLDQDLAVIHQVDVDYGRPPAPFDDTSQLRAFIGDRFQFNFFAVIQGELWQVFGAAIQDPNFWRHETPVRGYFLLGKRWDETWLVRLGDLTQSRLEVHTGVGGYSPAPAGFSRPVRGLAGEPVAFVTGNVDTVGLQAVREALGQEYRIVMAGFLLLAAAVVIAFGFLVLRPLTQILRSLESRNPTPLASLLRARSPFGEIARLLSSQFRQGRMLQDEIRRHLDSQDPSQAARTAESSADLRVRLAQDLHDGPLQSLYAAGLRLAALQKQRTAGQEVPPEELASVGLILNECSANLRNLLFGLEPEELRDHDLEAALERLERYLLSVISEFELSLEDHALDGLTREAQVHLFYICRELVSNAIRHARPTTAALGFTRRDGFLLVKWANDGVLDPASSPAPGNGLRNIEQRVEAMDGSCQYRLSRNRWTIAIELPYTSLIAPLSLDRPEV